MRRSWAGPFLEAWADLQYCHSLSLSICLWSLMQTASSCPQLISSQVAQCEEISVDDEAVCSKRLRHLHWSLHSQASHSHLCHSYRRGTFFSAWIWINDPEKILCFRPGVRFFANLFQVEGSRSFTNMSVSFWSLPFLPTFPYIEEHFVRKVLNGGEATWTWESWNIWIWSLKNTWVVFLRA